MTESIATSKAGKKGKPPRSVYLDLGIWRDKRGQIHMASRDGVFTHTTVSNKPGSVRYHPNLYKKLDRVLKSKGL